MNCPSCNASVPEAAKFCSECGAPLPRACPACGHGNPASAKFCSECGAQLAPPSSLLSPATREGLAGGQPRFASAKDYTPKHLAQKILTSRAVLEGERKQVTVLFADLKGSMELIAERDPEEARAILEPAPMRITRCAPVTQRCACRRQSADLPASCATATALRYRSASGSIPALWW